MKYLKFSLLSCLAIILSIQISTAQDVTQKAKKSSCSKVKEAKSASAVKSTDYKMVEKTVEYSDESSKVASAVAEAEVESSSKKKSCTQSKSACKKAKNAKVASAVQEKELKHKSCSSKKEKSN